MNKYTFIDLLEKKCFEFSKIEIPLLQRDYVQGQKETGGNLPINKTGFRFIKEIFESLKNKKTMDLDFIYGSMGNGKSFIPLDGQQRLTTLFLLHWYFACKDFNDKELDKKLAMLSNFTYETRISSRDFCIELSKLKKSFTSSEQPSDYIRNESWFFNRYNLDPTVSSMLNMLDVIHEFDTDANIHYSQLNNIKFNVLNINKFGLTEELYLKMNARGKLLTNFEKIKAEIEKKSIDSEWEKNIGEENKFFFKVDRIWTDLFWNNFKGALDDAFLNFIGEIVIIEQTLQIKNLENEKGKSSIKRIQNLADNIENLSIEDINEEIFNKLKTILDLYASNGNESKKPSIELWEYCHKNNTFFLTICKIEDGAEVTYAVRSLFYAQTLYLLNADFSKETYNDWLRVIRNIAKNTNIDSVQSFKGFLNLITELSTGTADIYNYLATHKVESNFAKNQVQEEIYKAKTIINNNRSSKKLILQFEENPFCIGKLYFAFYCCGINCLESYSDLDLVLFEKVKNVFDLYLSNDDISDDFRVLLFTCGNNRFYDYWLSWSYKTNTNKRCCIESTDDLYWHFSRIENDKYFKDFLKEAVLRLTKNVSIRKLISMYKCPSDMPEWEKWIIKNPDEFSEHCSGHYFGITSNNKTCYLYEWRKRPNDRNDCFKVPNH